MRQVQLPALGQATTCLGFGCVGLTALNSRRQALALLECAFESGIRHFDVARAYGMGVAENLLGDFLQTRRSDVTVTTKFGISPPAYGQRIPFLPAVKRVLKQIPAVDHVVRRKASAASTMGNFSSVAARDSLHASLRALRTDYIDVWLLHEADLAAASNPELLEFLDQQQNAGTIRRFGIGSNYTRLLGDCALFPSEHSVFQFENDVTDPHRHTIRNTEGRTIITHSAFKNAVDCVQLIASRHNAVARFQQDTGIDLLETRILYRMLLAWALNDNHDGVVLFGSTSLKNIRENAHVASNSELSPAVTDAFRALLAQSAWDAMPAQK